MAKRTFNIVLAVITIISILAAFALTNMSMQISKNKVASKAKEEILGTWTDTTNPQMIIQFTNDNEYKVMGQTQATYSVDPNNNIITLKYTEEFGGMTEYYTYTFNSNHSEVTLSNVDTGQAILYSR